MTEDERGMFLERAAIMEYDGGMERNRAERLALMSLESDQEKATTMAQENQITLTHLEMETLTTIRSTRGLDIKGQDQEIKKAVHRLIKKGIAHMKGNGLIFEKTE